MTIGEYIEVEELIKVGSSFEDACKDIVEMRGKDPENSVSVMMVADEIELVSNADVSRAKYPEKLGSLVKSSKSVRYTVFGQLISIESIIKHKGLESTENFVLLLSKMYRPASEEYFNDDHPDKEDEIVEELMSVDALEILMAASALLVDRTQFLKENEGVIYSSSNEDDESVDEEEDEEDVPKPSGLEEVFNDRFFWFNLTMVLCNEDRLRRAEAELMPTYEAFKHIAHYNTVNRMERDRLNEMKMKNKYG